MLALLSITYPIAPGHAGGVVRFYSEVLGAAMSKTKQAREQRPRFLVNFE